MPSLFMDNIYELTKSDAIVSLDFDLKETKLIFPKYRQCIIR